MRYQTLFLALMFASGMMVGAGITGQYYEANPTTVIEYQTHTVTEYVAPDGYVVFQFTNKRHWEWPTTVEFEAANMSSGEFETVFETTVERREPVAVPLDRSKQYRIKATAADGETRVLGSLEIRKDHYEIIIKACCVDDFS